MKKGIGVGGEGFGASIPPQVGQKSISLGKRPKKQQYILPKVGGTQYGSTTTHSDNRSVIRAGSLQPPPLNLNLPTPMIREQ